MGKHVRFGAVGALSVVGLMLMASSALAAQPVTVKVLAPTPVLTEQNTPATPSVNSALLQQQIGKAIIERLEKRLAAAEVKDAKLSSTAGATITVTVFGDYSKEWILGVIVPVGRFGVHPIVDVSEALQDLSGDLPKGIAFKEPSSGSSESAYLWAKDRAALDGFVRRVALPGVILGVAPDAQGWRVIAYGDALITDRHIAQTSLQRSAHGEPYGVLTLKDEAKKGWEGFGDRARFVMVLDQEIIAQVGMPASSTKTQLQVMCATVKEHKAKERCVAQIVGRLAATLPTALIPSP